MDIVKYEQAALHTRGVNHREGSFRYKDLGQGTPGRPENFYLRMVWTEGDFFSPRHMHNFDQVRVQIQGKFSFDKDGTMQPGCIGYFPKARPTARRRRPKTPCSSRCRSAGPAAAGGFREREAPRGARRCRSGGGSGKAGTSPPPAKPGAVRAALE